MLSTTKSSGNAKILSITPYYFLPSILAVSSPRRLPPPLVAPQTVGWSLALSKSSFQGQLRWIQTQPEEKPSKAALGAQILKESKSTDVAPPPEPKKSLWQRIKHEVVHYWHGSKLLAKETRIASSLFWKSTVKGQQLTRREHKQLVRTTADVFRLVPFLIFVIIPFMEFALPIALRLFPNMLPSTFETKFQEVCIILMWLTY